MTFMGFALAMWAATDAPRDVPKLKPEQVQALVAKIGQREPFLGSATARRERSSLYRYFNAADYALIRGNDVLGYWDRGAFSWVVDEVAWDGISGASSSAAAISKQAWAAAFRYVAKLQGLKVVRAAAVRIEGACVTATVDPTDESPVPGVLIEVRLRSPSGVMRYRLAVGKPSVEEAMTAALNLVIQFSRGD
jgi:hypothetical protein